MNIIQVLLIALIALQNAWSFSGAGAGTEASPYQIKTLEQLQEIENDLDADYVLMQDIDASATAEWNGGKGFIPIGQQKGAEFRGTFDGQHHTILNLTIKRPLEKHVGLFGQMRGEAEGVHPVVRNLILRKVSIFGKSNMGAVTGFAWYADIMDCHVSGTLIGSGGGLVGALAEGASMIRSSSHVTITGQYIGGLIGTGYRSGIQESYSNSTIIGTETTGSIGGISGGGTSQSTFDSYALGTIEAMDSEDLSAGGILGGGNYSPLYRVFSNMKFSNSVIAGVTHADVHVENSFWNADNTPLSSNQSKATSLNTASMKEVSTFTDAQWLWSPQSEDGVWIMGTHHPLLKWQQPILRQQPASIELEEDFSEQQIDLNQYFRDPEGFDLVFSISVSETDQISAQIQDNLLILRSVPHANGSTQITITAQDQDNLSISTTLSVVLTNTADAPIRLQALPDLNTTGEKDTILVQNLDDYYVSRDFPTEPLQFKIHQNTNPEILSGIWILSNKDQQKLTIKFPSSRISGETQIILEIIDQLGVPAYDTLTISIEKTTLLAPPKVIVSNWLQRQGKTRIIQISDGLVQIMNMHGKILYTSRHGAIPNDLLNTPVLAVWRRTGHPPQTQIIQ